MDKKSIINKSVYRGGDSHNGILYFSTNHNFAKDYGEVSNYVISISKVFDTTDHTHLSIFFNRVPSIEDPYSGEEYDLDQYLDSDLFATDTWELFEPYIKYIKALGYTGMIIYEGGVENYVVFPSEDNSVKLIESKNKKIIKESLSPIVYYFCLLDELEDILSSNSFHLMSNLGTPSDKNKDTEGYHFFMSTARIYYGGYVRRNIQDGSVILTLDGNKLNQRYKAVSFDFWGRDYQNAALRMDDYEGYFKNDENEDRIVSNKESIPNAVSYIKEVNILVQHRKYASKDTLLDVATEEGRVQTFTSSRFYSRIRNIKDLLDNVGIPVYVYVDEKDFVLKNKKKALNFYKYRNAIKELSDYLLGKIPKDEKGRLTYSKEHEHVIGAITREWEARDFAQSLASEIHSERAKPAFRSNIQVIVNAMKKYKASNLQDLMIKLHKEYDKQFYNEERINNILDPLRLIN